MYYFDIEAYDTAAKFAGCAFEKAVEQKCEELAVPLENSDGRKKSLACLIEDLCEEMKVNDALFFKANDLRIKAAHPKDHHFSREEINFMLESTEEITRWERNVD